MSDMKSVSVKKGILHVETPLGIVNINVGLSDRYGREVVAVETIPDNYAGEKKVLRRGTANVRLIRSKTVKGGR